MPSSQICLFCGRTMDLVPVMLRSSLDTYLCSLCIDRAHSGLHKDELGQFSTFDPEKLKDIKPIDIFKHLEEYVIGQTRAKKSISTAVYNHYKKIRHSTLGKEVQLDKSNMIMAGPTGCHAKGQGILMFDGYTKNVEDVMVGDFLMGPDSKKRIVKKLIRGKQEMVDIVPIKGNPFRVNLDHILSLVRIDGGLKGQIVNISVREYLTKSNTFKNVHKLYRSSIIEFEQKQSCDLDAYLFGTWLGDGDSNRAGITSMDNEIISRWRDFAKANGLTLDKIKWQNSGKATSYVMVDKNAHSRPNTNRSNIFLDFLNNNNLIKNKHIPHAYKCGPYYDRTMLLAGILDTDGYFDNNCYSLVQKNESIANDVAFIAKSLGLAAYVSKIQKTCTNNGVVGEYFSVSISGNVDKIPCKLERKKANSRKQIKNCLRTGFKVVHTNRKENFYGFQISDDSLYLLDDFTVSHNCGKTYLWKTVAKFLGVPFSQGDATTLTQAGYVGDDVENLLVRLYQKTPDDLPQSERKRLTEIGIIFIDEIDKISRKGESQSLTRDVSGEGTQQALLKLLEGSACTIPADPHPGGRKHPEQKVIEINTENILFVVGGAFVGLDEIISKRISTSSIGFGAETKSAKKEKAGAMLKQVVVDDFVKFGMLPELMGRLPIITTLEDLSEEDMTKILTQPKNALLKQFVAMFEMDNQKLVIEKDAIHEIVIKAMERNTGARGLRGVVEEVLEDVMFDSPSSKVEEVTITAKQVREKLNKTSKIAA